MYLPKEPQHQSDPDDLIAFGSIFKCLLTEDLKRLVNEYGLKKLKEPDHEE